MIEKERGFVYFRFRNSFVPLCSVMYVNPFSMRFCISVIVFAVLHVYSSSSL